MRFDSTDRAAGIAGVASFVAALVPWSVSGSSSDFSESVVMRFVFGPVEMSFGTSSTDMTATAVAVTRIGTRSGSALSRAVCLYLAVAGLLVLALVVGVGVLLAGERLARGAFDPVRPVGMLCLAAALFALGGSVAGLSGDLGGPNSGRHGRALPLRRGATRHR